MRLTAVVAFMTVAIFSGCSKMTNGSSVDRATSQKLSDSYMSDLVADRVDLALDKMEPEFIEAAGGKTKAEAALRSLFDYCGRPLNSEMKHDETGFYSYADGRKPAPMRAFFYSGKTTQYEKGVCFFAVRVVPEESGMKVVNFGPLKLISGQLPDWAR
jgi:hypothetical protein